jgi:hypothetical protein
MGALRRFQALLQARHQTRKLPSPRLAGAEFRRAGMSPRGGRARRSREIGIRIALGARPGEVVWMVLRDDVLVLAGLSIGLPGSYAAARQVASLLFGVKTDGSRGIRDDGGRAGGNRHCGRAAAGAQGSGARATLSFASGLNRRHRSGRQFLTKKSAPSTHRGSRTCLMPGRIPDDLPTTRQRRCGEPLCYSEISTCAVAC